MRKPLLAAVGILVIAGFVWVTGLHTYFIERRVDEALPSMPVVADSPPPSVVPAVPQTLLVGTFVDSDAIHTGTGIASVLAYPDGSRILRFEDFDVVNGPDVFVYLSENADPKTNGLGAYLDLGPLKGNIGSQNYTLPADTSAYKSVALWCKKFGVLFPYATLEAVK